MDISKMCDDLLSTFNLLKVKDNEETLDTLDKLITLLQALHDDRDVICSDIPTQDIFPLLLDLLLSSSDCRTKVAHVTAELAKTEALRAKFVDHNFISPLVKLLAEDDILLCTQACRALGNICYENDDGRESVDKADGISALLQLLKAHTLDVRDEAKRLRVIACGFLLNLTNSNDGIQDKAVGGGALDVLCEYVTTHMDDQELCSMVLPTFTSLFDSVTSRDEMSMIKVTLAVLSLLSSKNGMLYEDTSLDLLMLLAENDDVKEMLALSELPHRLVQLVSENTWRAKDEEQVEGKDEAVTMAADLVVALLRGDKSMQILYGKGDGEVFEESLRWLDSNNEHLEIAGSLAVGNFARNDENCVKLVDSRVVPQLLALLEDPQKKNITLQHACLSALRNLAIPVANKPILVASGVLSIVLKLASVEVMPVVFKLLGVIRMLIDGQKEAAMFVVAHSFFMAQLVDWCTVEEHAGVKGESTRLLAWLIKNTNVPTVHSAVIKAEAVTHLVSMVISEHIVMQTEALLALTLMCRTVLEEALTPLREADIVRVLCSVLKNESSATEVLCNALALTSALTNHKSMKDEMLEVGIDDVIEKLKTHDDAKVREAAVDVSSRLSIPDDGGT